MGVDAVSRKMRKKNTTAEAPRKLAIHPLKAEKEKGGGKRKEVSIANEAKKNHRRVFRKTPDPKGKKCEKAVQELPQG